MTTRQQNESEMIKNCFNTSRNKGDTSNTEAITEHKMIQKVRISINGINDLKM